MSPVVKSVSGWSPEWLLTSRSLNDVLRFAVAREIVLDPKCEAPEGQSTRPTMITVAAGRAA